jgi:iron(III) transport system permease protein
VSLGQASVSQAGTEPVAPPKSRRQGREQGRLARAKVTPGLVVLSALCLVLFAWPVAMLALGSFRTAPPGLGGRWSLGGFSATLSSSSVWRAFGNSLILSGTTVVVATSLALYLAWIVTRTNAPLRRLVTPMMVLVFVIPPMFFALSWAMLGEQPVGLLDKAMSIVLGATPINAQSWYGMIAVSVMGATAPEYLLLLGPMQRLDRSLEEGALLCGASRLRAFLQIEVFVLAPAIFGVVILGFVVGLGFLPVPLLLGQPAGILLLPTEIYGLINGHTPAEYAGGSTVSLLLVAVVLVLVALQWRLLGRRQFTTVTGRSYRSDRTDIGRWKWLGSATIALFGLCALVLPLGQFVLGSFEPYFGIYRHLTLSNYAAVLSSPGIRKAFETTFLLGAVAGFAASVLALWVALASKRARSRLARLPELTLWVLWAVPGITLGLGLIWAYLSLPGLKDLYATEWIVLIALVVGSAPIASRAMAGSIAQLGQDLEEAARVHGASAARALVGIVVRLVLPSFLAGWFLTAIVAAGNLDIPILLASPGNQTVPLLAENLFADGSLSQAAAVFCLFIAAVAALLVLVLAAWLASRRLRAARQRAKRVEAQVA